MVDSSLLTLAMVLLLGTQSTSQSPPAANDDAGAVTTLPVPSQGLDATAEGDPEDAELPNDASPFDQRRPGFDDDESANAATGLSFSLTLGGARDTGLRSGEAVAGAADPGAAIDGVEDSIYVVGPSLLLHRRPSRRSEVILGYQGELEQFDRQGELDATHHAAGARIEHMTSRRSRLVFGGSLLDGEDPSRHLGGQLLVMPRTPFSQSRLFAGFEHTWSATGLQLYVGRTATEIEPALGLLEAGIDESDYAATLIVDRTLGKRTGLVGSYTYVVPEWSAGPDTVLDGGDEFAADRLPLALSDPFHTAVIGISHRPAKNITLHVAGGMHYSDRTDVLASAGIARDGTAFSFGLRYEYSLLTLGTFSSAAIGSPAPPIGPSAALRDAVSRSVTASFAVRPIDRLRFEQRLWGAKSSLASSEPFETVSATSRLVVEMVRRLGIFGQYDWFEQSGGFLPVEDISRSRVSVGLIIGVTGQPKTWSVRQDSLLLGRVLPSTRKD